MASSVRVRGHEKEFYYSFAIILENEFQLQFMSRDL